MNKMLLKYTHFCRPVGSDIAKGEKVLEKSQKIGPSELGILATVGAARVTCYRLPVVGVMSTGNEVSHQIDLLWFFCGCLRCVFICFSFFDYFKFGISETISANIVNKRFPH